MKSWDFFDTLAGRTCGEPWRLFEVVGGPAYVQLRQEAEKASDKTWAGIGRQLAQVCRLPAARVAELQAAEWAAELAAAFPIRCNADAVRPGDRIVSDTYFDAGQVRQLADRIGIPQGVEIVTSWHDKWTGKYWRTAAARESGIHVGDNLRSDLSQPLAHGINAERFCEDVHEWEALWSKAGLWEIAAAARAARLQNPHQPGTPEAAWWNGAARAGVPFLLIAAALVHDYRQIVGRGPIFFVSRDSLLLGETYAALYGERVHTFHASRATLSKPSAEFLTYVKAIPRDALLVDLHGTGKSLAQFEAAADLELSAVFVCGQKRLRPYAPALVHLPAIGTGTAVEVMNYHHEGRVVDVVGGRPVRAPLEYDRRIVDVHRAAILAGVRSCCRPPRGVTPDHLREAADLVRRTVPRELVHQHEVQHAAP